MKFGLEHPWICSVVVRCRPRTLSLQILFHLSSPRAKEIFVKAYRLCCRLCVQGTIGLVSSSSCPFPPNVNEQLAFSPLVVFVFTLFQALLHAPRVMPQDEKLIKEMGGNAKGRWIGLSHNALVRDDLSLASCVQRSLFFDRHESPMVGLKFIYGCFTLSIL